MKNKEEIFKLLRESVEDERETKIVEDLINKITFTMPSIEVVDETHVKFSDAIFYKNKKDEHYCLTSSLHREVWRYFYGLIPQGLDVHHKDFDAQNNNIDNLQILTKSQHLKIHSKAGCKRVKRAKRVTRQCLFCGKNFECIEARKQQYCSRDCVCAARKARTVQINATKKVKTRKQNREVKKCEFCGKVFVVLISRRQKYCCRDCSVKARIKLVTHQCKFCGKIFTSRKSDDKIYCSRKCSARDRYKNSSETNICPVCGKSFTAWKSSHKKYCSKKCFHEANRKNNK